MDKHGLSPETGVVWSENPWGRQRGGREGKGSTARGKLSPCIRSSLSVCALQTLTFFFSLNVSELGYLMIKICVNTQVAVYFPLWCFNHSFSPSPLPLPPLSLSFFLPRSPFFPTSLSSISRSSSLFLCLKSSFPSLLGGGHIPWTVTSVFCRNKQSNRHYWIHIFRSSKDIIWLNSQMIIQRGKYLSFAVISLRLKELEHRARIELNAARC